MTYACFYIIIVFVAKQPKPKDFHKLFPSIYTSCLVFAKHCGSFIFCSFKQKSFLNIHLLHIISTKSSLRNSYRCALVSRKLHRLCLCDSPDIFLLENYPNKKQLPDIADSCFLTECFLFIFHLHVYGILLL